MSERLVNEFNLYGELLEHGNRHDMQDGDDEYASWQADRAPELDTESTKYSWVSVWSDDGGPIRRFLVSWEEY